MTTTGPAGASRRRRAGGAHASGSTPFGIIVDLVGGQVEAAHHLVDHELRAGDHPLGLVVSHHSTVLIAGGLAAEHAALWRPFSVAWTVATSGTP